MARSILALTRTSRASCEEGERLVCDSESFFHFLNLTSVIHVLNLILSWKKAKGGKEKAEFYRVSGVKKAVDVGMHDARHLLLGKILQINCHSWK